MAPWIVWGLSEVPAIEKKVCPPTMGGEPPRAIKHPAVIGLDGLRAPVTVVGVFLCLPQQGIVSMVSQEPGASRSQHRLSSFLRTRYGSRGCNAVGCANVNDHMITGLTTNTRSCFSAPEAVLNEVEQRFDCVQAQTHMYSSLVGGFRPHPKAIPTPPIGCFHPPRSCEPKPTRMKKEMKEATKQGKS